MITFPREATKFIAVDLTDDETQEPITTGWDVCCQPLGARPTGGWAAPSTVEGQAGIVLTGLTPGYYVVWARLVGNPETDVVDCGQVHVL